MPLDSSDWSQIYKAIERSQSPSIMVQGKVVKADPQNNLIWLKEFGGIPIPLFGFDYEVTYFDTQPVGNAADGFPVNTQLIKNKARVKIVCPKVGDIALVIKQHGSRKLPKCVGVLKSTGFSAGSSE